MCVGSGVLLFLSSEAEHVVAVAEAEEVHSEPESGHWPYINTPLMLLSPLGPNVTSETCINTLITTCFKLAVHH